MKHITFTNDCFADAGDSCKVIGDKKCKGCGFYKTQIRLEISKKRALRRLKTLEEAARILKDYPHLKYYEAIMKAKEVLKDERNIQEFSKSDNTRTSNVDV